MSKSKIKLDDIDLPDFEDALSDKDSYEEKPEFDSEMDNESFQESEPEPDSESSSESDSESDDDKDKDNIVYGGGIYSNRKCTSKHGKFTPQPHQTKCLEFFKDVIMKDKHLKGLLLFHKLGSGKTCTSFLISDYLLKTKQIKKVFILTPGTLREGWIREYCKVCGENPKYLNKHYIFATYNFSIKDRFKKLNLDNSLVIIDEVHNLINGYKNNSPNPTTIYNKIKESKCKLLLLSGTPIFSNLFETCFIGKLLKPKEFPDIKDDSGIINETPYMNMFKENEETGEITCISSTKFKKLFRNIISFVAGNEEKFYPNVEYMKPLELQMSSDQDIKYWYVAEVEAKLMRKKKNKKSKKERDKLEEQLSIVALKRILTRAVCNFWYPPEIDTGYYDSELKTKIEGTPDLTEENGGWVSCDVFKDYPISQCSPKFLAVIQNIIENPNEKHVIFSFYKTRCGVNLFKAIFDLVGIKSIIFSGDLNDSERKTIIENFNSDENIRGEKTQIMLLTEAGAEGITLKTVRHFHILESNPAPVKIKQSIGRVARYKSHEKLPEKERNVKIWRYLSTSKLGTTSDVELYKNTERKLKNIDSFLDLLKKTSIT